MAEKKRKRELKRPIGTQRICAVWTTVAEYMQFYQEWVMICAVLNQSTDNPNWWLASRWNRKGRKV